MLDWDMIAEEIEEKKWDIEAEEAAKWLHENDHRIDWDEFEEWYDEVVDKPGYEWLRGAYMLYSEWKEKNGEERRWDKDGDRHRDGRDGKDGRGGRDGKDGRGGRGGKDGKGERGGKDGKGGRGKKDQYNSEKVSRSFEDDHHHQVPLWAACAITGLAVAVFALFVGLCCLYR